MGIEHQLQRYVVYTCKKCGWQTAVLAQWSDLKPKKCANKKCNCFFLKEPSQLEVRMPKEETKRKRAPSQKFSKKKTKATSKKSTKKKSTDDRQKEGQRSSKEEGTGEDSSSS